VRPPVDRPDDPNVYDRVLYNDIRWADSAPNGAVDIGSDDSDCEGAAGEFVFGCLDGIPDFTGSGQIYDRGLLIPSSGGRTIGGSSTPTAGYFGDFLPYLKRHNVNVLSSFEFSRAARLFVEGKWVDTDAFTVSQPTYDFFTRLAPDNAYLIQRFGADAAVGGALVSRDNLDFGIRGDRSDRQTLRGVIGLDGKITDHLRYEASFTYGRVNNATTSVNDRYADRYYAALDAVVGPNGQITCRINLPGETVIDENNYGEAPTTFNKGDCKPLTLLGQANSEGLAFVLATHTSKSRLTQEVASGYLAGDFGKFFDLPGGPIGFALGAEYRKEGSSQTPSKEFQQGLLLDSAEIEPAGGSFDVKEAFAELNVPLLKDLPFAKELSFGGAVRFSDYSTVGNTTTWKVDGIYAPVRDATFRGTYSKAVRAPNISELFDPLSGTFAFITDPCDFNNVTSGSQFRQANCTAQLSALGLTSAEIAAFNPANDAEASTSQPGQVGGNPNLGAENARTWTAGVVLRPRFLRGLTVSADYYDIKLKNAVNYASVSELFALCVDQPTLNNQYCNLIQRNPDTGFAGGFTQTPQNVAAFTTRGLDLQMNYRFSPSAQIGTFNVKIVGGWLRDLTFISTPGADLDQDRGEAYSPRYIGVADLTWTKGPLTLNYGLAYQSRTLRFTPEQLRANPDIADPKYIYYRERWEHDIQAQFAVDRDKFTFSAGVNNLFDSKPDVSSGGNYPYGAVGRYFYVGVKAKVF
jgi:outer membrane receptor protein involved in Fe transport